MTDENQDSVVNYMSNVYDCDDDIENTDLTLSDNKNWPFEDDTKNTIKYNK